MWIPLGQILSRLLILLLLLLSLPTASVRVPLFLTLDQPDALWKGIRCWCVVKGSLLFLVLILLDSSERRLNISRTHGPTYGVDTGLPVWGHDCSGDLTGLIGPFARNFCSSSTAFLIGWLWNDAALMLIVLIYIPVVGSSLNWGAIKGQGFCTHGIIVIISRDVKGAKYTKQNKLKPTCVLKENVSSSGHVPVPLHLRADIFCWCCRRCSFVEKNTCPNTQESIVKMLWH